MATLPYRFAIGICCALIIRYALDDACETDATRLRFWMAVFEVCTAGVMLVWSLFLKDEYLFTTLAWVRSL